MIDEATLSWQRQQQPNAPSRQAYVHPYGLSVDHVLAVQDSDFVVMITDFCIPFERRDSDPVRFASLTEPIPHSYRRSAQDGCGQQQLSTSLVRDPAVDVVVDRRTLAHAVRCDLSHRLRDDRPGDRAALASGSQGNPHDADPEHFTKRERTL